VGEFDHPAALGLVVCAVLPMNTAVKITAQQGGSAVSAIRVIFPFRIPVIVPQTGPDYLAGF